MSKFGLMVDRHMDPTKVPILVDLGSVEENSSRERADALMKAGISRLNFSIEGRRRLLVKLPPHKADAIFGHFPIVVGSTYWQTTHHWRGLADGEAVARVPAHKTAMREDSK